MNRNGHSIGMYGGIGLAAAAMMLTASRTPAQQVTEVVPEDPIAIAVPAAPIAADARVIDLAICLDTSGSMDGLIEAAKQKLWAIVNDLALAEPTPKLRVALLSFGNDGHLAEDGWVAIQTPFTDDLDLVSQRLFALTTNGGTEYVGRVLNRAGGLEWDPSEDSLKLIVVAGNESADQDQQTPFRTVCPQLIARGIMVNSIYCGPAADEIAPAWREVAMLTDGKFASIDKDHGTIVIETPFDEQLGALSASLNTTYIPYGAQGKAGAEQQWIQDENAQSLNSAAVAQRCQTKGGALYSNAQWDLVDACKAEGFELAKVEVEDLPENMQKMTPKEREAYVARMTKTRAELQKQITEATQKRTVFVQAEQKKQQLDDSKAFDTAVRKAIRAQAVEKGFRFKEEAKPETVEPITEESTADASGGGAG